MSSVFTLDDDPIVIVVPAGASIPPGNITEAEWLAIKDRVTVVEGIGLADLSDTDLDGLADGNALIWEASSQTWVPGTASIPVGGFDNDVDRNKIVPDIREIYPRYGLVAAASGQSPFRYILQPVYGTSARTVAEGNHTHVQPLPVRVTTAPSGYISGGSQPLGSTSVTLPNGIACVVEAELYGQFRGADSGAAYYTVSITIGGNTFTSPGGSDGFWCVQGVPDKIQWQHERRLTGTGSAVSVSASVAWHSGSGFNIDRTYLKVRVRPDR